VPTWGKSQTHAEKVQYGGLSSTYINLGRGGFQTSVACLYVLSVSFSIDGCRYEPLDMESGLDKFQVVSQRLCDP
jgi:hypothetical protein